MTPQRAPSPRGAGTRSRRLARAAGFAVVVGLPVVALAWLVRAQAPLLVSVDEAAILAGTDLTRGEPALRTALVAWQETFQARWVVPAGLLLCLWVWRRRGLGGRAAWAAVTLLVAWGLANVVKEVVRRARPVVDDAVAHAPGYSFPSGHAATTTAAAVTVVVLLWPLLGRRARVVVPAVGALLVVLTAVDRVLLGVHYPSDVVAGIAFGASVAGASALAYLGGSGSPPRHPLTPDPEEVPGDVHPALRDRHQPTDSGPGAR